MTSNPHHPKGQPVKRGYFYYLGLGMPTPIFILLEVVMVWAIYHAVTTRTTTDYLTYGGVLGIPIGLLLVKIWVTEWRASNRLSIWKKAFLLVNLIPGSVFLGAIYYSLAASAYDFLRWLFWLWHQPYAGPFLVSAAVFLLGMGLFGLRLRYRATYGFSEILAGISIASYKYIEASTGSQTAVPTDPNLIIALLTAGVYLVVRGLDNMHHGLTVEPVDPIFRPLLTWYRSVGEVMIDEKESTASDHKTIQE